VPLFGREKTLFRLFGLPIKADVSWLLLVVLVMFSLANGYFPSALGPGADWRLRWGLAVVGTAALFASLVAHELCHSLVAQRTGMPVAGITLFIFGGVSQLEDEPPTAGSEFLMAVVGPVSSALIGCVALLVWLTGHALGWPPPALALLGYLWVVNFLLAGFNSLPAFPLDGGRVLRSIIWAITKDLRLATDVAAQIGSLFGFGFILLGGVLLLGLKGGIITGVWFIIIGFFLRQAAMSSLQMVAMRQQLEGDNVSRFMTSDVVSVPYDTDLESFVNDYVFRHRFTYYPVVDGEGRLVGLISAHAPRDVDQMQWPDTTVARLMKTDIRNILLDPDADAVDALAMLRAGDVKRIIVVRDARPVGIISLRDLLRFLALKIDLTPRGR